MNSLQTADIVIESDSYKKQLYNIDSNVCYVSIEYNGFSDAVFYIAKGKKSWMLIDDEQNVRDEDICSCFEKALFVKTIGKIVENCKAGQKSFLGLTGKDSSIVYFDEAIRRIRDESTVEKPYGHALSDLFTCLTTVQLFSKLLFEDKCFDNPVFYTAVGGHPSFEKMLRTLVSYSDNLQSSFEMTLQEVSDEKLDYLLRGILFCLNSIVSYCQDGYGIDKWLQPNHNSMTMACRMPLSETTQAVQQGNWGKPIQETPTQESVDQVINALGQQSVSVPSRLQSLFPPEILEAMNNNTLKLESSQSFDPQGPSSRF